MRIIAGSARGRKLFSPAGNEKKHPIRPTADRCRESLFNILGAELVADCRVLDLFAGTGALGLEALSRGAESAVFVDSSSAAIQLIARNIQTIGFSSYQLVKRDITRGLFFLKNLSAQKLEVEQISTGSGHEPLSRTGFDLAFLDPPYLLGYCNQALTELVDNGLLNPGATVVCEEHRSCSFPNQVKALRLYDNRVYGDTGFWFYTFEESSSFSLKCSDE